MENTKKYLDKNDVIAQIKYIDISPDDLINADNYDETLLLDKFLKYSINEQNFID